MSKNARKGLIFLDYLRNDRLSTAVSPLSPRVRPGAPVSMPITWDQVRPGLDPSRFTIRTVPGLLARSKAWQGYEDAARPVVKAIELLAKSQKTAGKHATGDTAAPASNTAASSKVVAGNKGAAAEKAPAANKGAPAEKAPIRSKGKSTGRKRATASRARSRSPHSERL
jgi:LigD-like primase-polymerase